MKRMRWMRRGVCGAIAALVWLLGAVQVEAHNLDSAMVYMYYDATTQALIDSRVNGSGDPLILDGDEIGLIVKVVPTDGTDTGVGGYVDFYVPDGVTVVDTAYVIPDGVGGYTPAPMKGQSPIAIGSGPVGANCTPALGDPGRLHLGPNIIGEEADAVDGAGCHNGTIAGVYGDTGIFYSTSPETAYGSYTGGTLTNNSGDTSGSRTTLGTPLNKWDTEQLAAYGIKGTSNPTYPSSPVVDPNGRGNAPWGNASAVAGPESGYAWEFDLDTCGTISNPCSSAEMKDASDNVGPWNRIQYPGSLISQDQPGLASNMLGTVGIDASSLGFDLNAMDLPSTVSQVDTTSTKTIRWAIGQLTINRPEYVFVKFKVDDSSEIIDASGCTVFHSDTFGGDAGGFSNGKDHLWRYYDPTEANWDPCISIGKPASRDVVSVGEFYDYSISVFNVGAIDLTNVVVTDILPAGVQFQSAVPAQNSGTGSPDLVWNVGDLDIGEKFEATVTVKATGTGDLLNTLEVTSTEIPLTTAVEVTPSGAIPYIVQSKTASPDTIAPGDSTAWTLLIQNIGSGASGSPTRIIENLPPDFTYTSLDSVIVNGATLTGSTTVNATDPTRPIFTIPSGINAGDQLEIVFTATSSLTIAAGSYCNSFTSLDPDNPLSTGAEGCVTVGGAKVGDTIYRDWNGDGDQDAGEDGLPGVTVEAYDGSCPPSGGVVATDTTDASGTYEMNVAAGPYCVVVGGGVPAGYTLTDDPDEAGTCVTCDGEHEVTLSMDEEYPLADFGYQPGGSGQIGDLIFEDTNNDGVFNGSDVGISAILVCLYADTDNDGIMDVPVTDAGTEGADNNCLRTNGSGNYSFTGLAEGVDYVVEVDETDPALAAYFNPNAFVATTDNPHLVTNLTGTYDAADFGYFANVPGSIGDEVCIDSNRDGSCAGETLLPFVTVELYDSTGMNLLATTSTSIGGTYNFGNLAAGDYVVKVDTTDPDIPAGFIPTVSSINVSLSAGQDIDTVDFPFVEIIMKEVDMAFSMVGNVLTYTIHVGDVDPAVSMVMITDSTPSGTTYAGNDSPPAAMEPSIGGTGTVQWDLGSTTAATDGTTAGGFLCTIEETLTVTDDTYLREDQTGRNYGSRDRIETNPGNNGTGDERHGLISFDLSGVPGGVTLTAAELTVTNNAQRNDHTLEVREATVGWTEGTMSDAACATGATWDAPNCTDTGTGWNGSGGDFGSSPSPWGGTLLGSFDGSVAGEQTVSGANLSQLVDDWIDGSATNNGLVLLATGTDNGQAQWGVREDDAGAELMIRYEQVFATGCPTAATLDVAADTYLREDQTGRNYGARDRIETDPSNNGASGDERHGLIRFDLGSIPGGATITSVELQVENTSTRNDHLVEVREATVGWTEGTMSDANCATGATWDAPNCTDTGTGWNGSAGDFGSSPSPWGGTLLGSLDGSVAGVQSVSGASLTQLVQDWLDGNTTNNGLVFLATGIDNGQAQWGVTEDGTGAKLAVTYLSTTVGTTLAVAGDTFLREDQTGRNYGAETDIDTDPGNNGVNNDERHGLITFDLGAIPASATITGAELRVENTSQRTNHTVEVRQATVGWTEGTGTDDNCITGASWAAPNCTDTGTGWNGSGGDFRSSPSPWDATVLGSLDGSVAGVQTVSGANLTQLAQDWVDGSSTNNGLVLLATGTDNGLAAWGTKEDGTGAELVVSYDAISAGTGTTAVLSASPSLVGEDPADGGDGAFTVTLTLTADGVVNNVVPDPASPTPLTPSSTSGGATATCGTASLVSADDDLDGTMNDSVVYEWSCTADASGVTSLPADVTFQASASGTDAGANPVDWATGMDIATSNNVLIVPPVTFQVTATGATDPISNVAFIEDVNFIPSTPSNPVETALSGSIGDRVWADLDGDGTDNGGTEPGLGGVRVFIDEDGDDEFDPGEPSALTDANGNYRIGDLSADNYDVRLDPTTIPAGYQPTTPNEQNVALADNEQYDDADFGLRPPNTVDPGSIGDTVCLDVDEDGCDASDAGLPGLTVLLLDGTGTILVASTTTDANGNYSFGGLYDESYIVAVDPNSPVDTPFGGTSTILDALDLVSGTHPHPVTLSSGEDYELADFGYNWGGSIGDFAWYDLDGDQTDNGGTEDGAPNTTILLYVDNNNGDGTGNGVLDPADTVYPIDGVVETCDAVGPGCPVVGYYLFDNLPPGDYIVKAEEQQVPAPPGSPNAGMIGTMVSTTGTEMPVSLAPKEDHEDADFGFIEGAEVAGHVFHDVNHNGVLDGGDIVLPGVTVTLTGTDVDSNPVNEVTTTNAGGEYEFLVPPGSYTITYSSVDVLALDPTLTDTTTPTVISLPTVMAGSELTGNDFGVDNIGQIGDTVYNDADGSGAQDMGEPGMAGVTVTLYIDVNNNGTYEPGTDTFADAQVTDGAGNYLFEGLADDDYVVVVDTGTIPLPVGFMQTGDPDEQPGACATCDDVGAATIEFGVTDVVDTVDFGYQPAGITRTISGRVYDDANNNGNDDGEAGFAGVDVAVMCDTGTFATVTDGTGAWSIEGIPDGSVCTVLDADEDDLPRSDYVATETPAGLTVSSDVTGLDFGYNQRPGSISGRVCYGDGDGQCAGDAGIGSVAVTLRYAGDDGILNTADDEIFNTNTNANGDYSFGNLEPGLYQVTETNPPGVSSIADADGGDPDNIGVTLLVDEDVTTRDFEDLAEPAIEITKSSNASGTNAVNDVITYTYDVENTGNVALTNVTVSDPHSGLSAITCTPVQGSTLAPAATMQCTATYTVTQADVDAGQIDNTGTVTAKDPNNNDVSDNDPLSEPVAQSPAIQIVKSSNASGTNDVNDVLTYTYDVENTGNVTLTNVLVTDPHAGLSAISCTPAQGSSLAPAATMQCTATYTVTQADVDTGQIDNTGTVTGTPPSGPNVDNSDPLSEPVAQTPAIQITKSSNATGSNDVNDVITYTYDVENTGNVTLTNVNVTDPHTGLSAITCSPAQGSTLAPAATMQCTATYTVTQADVDAGQIDNTGTATGTPPSGPDATDDDPLSEPVAQTPAIQIDKSSNATGTNVLNDVITYTYDVENTGNVTLTNVTVTDPHTGLSAITCTPAQGSTLAPAATMQCTATYTVTQADVDAGQIDNTGSVTAKDPDDNDVTDDDPLSEPVGQDAAIKITKSSNATGTNAVGDVITYTYDVENVGIVTLTDVTVTDPHTGLSAITCTPAQGSTLAPAATMQCTATYTVTQDDVDAGQINNTGTATGTDPGDVDVSNDDPLSEPVAQSPAIEIVKSSNATGSNAVNDVLTYTYDVENTGNVTLTDVNVTDPHTGLSAISCTPAQGSTLAPAATMQCTATYTVTQDDVDAGQIDNTGTAAGTDPDDNDVTDDDPLSEPVAQSPAIQITKSSNATGTNAVNDVLTYTYDVENTGNVTLTNVNVTDPHTGLSAITCTPSQGSTLAAAATMQCTATYTVTQDDVDAGQIDNTGTATGTPPSGPDVSNDDPLSEPVAQSPAIEIVKSSDATGSNVVNDVLTYTYDVENTGNVNLTNVNVTDPHTGLSAISCTPAQGSTLVPGATMQCTATYTVTQDDVDAGQIDNTGTATGTPPSGQDVSDDDPLSEPVAQGPAIQIVKSSDATGANVVNDVITYTYDVENTGNVTLTGVTVTDPHTGLSAIACAPAQGSTLVPGATMQCTATYTVTQADVDAGQIDNTGTATGTPPSGPDTSDDDALSEPVPQPAELTLDKSGTLDLGADGIATAGDQINYTFLVTNTGGATLSNIDVTDPMVAPITCPSGNPIPSLVPSASETCTGSYAITQTDINAGQKVNTATATGQDPGGNPVIDQDTHTQPIGLGSIVGIVFDDVNDNGVKDPGEAGLGGVLIQLYDSTGTNLLDETHTDSNGDYSFTGLAAGDYFVRETDPDGFRSTTSNTVAPVKVPTNGVGTADFGDRIGTTGGPLAACGNGTVDPTGAPLRRGPAPVEQCDSGQMLCGLLALNALDECATDDECFGDTCSICGIPGPGLCVPPGNRDDVGNACRSDCTLPVCGDGVTDMDNGEECDDGNDSNTDGCTNDCLPNVCGDGFACSENNPISECPNGKELCDDGNLKNGDGCSDVCVPEICGDGIVQDGEQCDAGQAVCETGPSAGKECASDAECFGGTCGTGAVAPPVGCLGCDPLVCAAAGTCDVTGAAGVTGNNNEQPNSCRSDCTPPSCGDGVLDTGNGEECDDGNASDNDGCLTNCRLATCGDGVLCFENNRLSPCTSGPAGNHGLCTEPDVGDALVRCDSDTDCEVGNGGPGGTCGGKEQCDDANTKGGDGCNPFCITESCGDGVVQDSEGCDNGFGLCEGGINGLPAATVLCAEDAQCFGGTCTGCFPALFDPANGMCGGTPGPNRDDLPNQCRSNCVLPFCGDGITDSSGGEECDDGNSSNNDGCLTTCQQASCGDGFVCNENNPESPCASGPSSSQGGVSTNKELCDDGNTKGGDGCSSLCIPENCGDAVRQDSEACDNGQGLCGSGLSANQPCDTDADCYGAAPGLGCIGCRPSVLFGILCNGAPGPNRDDLAGQCRSNCALPHCGDGATDTGEQCDDGNLSNNDTCLGNCRLARCGDGNFCGDFDLKDPDAGGNCSGSCAADPLGCLEECDDGNSDDRDGCNTVCELTSCGDGIVQSGEQCDLGQSVCSGSPFPSQNGQPCAVSAQCLGGTCGPGNLDDVANSCRSNCRLPSCGDGIVDNGEQCDDGDNASGDTCTETCTINVCGDGDQNPATEQCDDGNLFPGDGCNATCLIERCGNGVAEPSFDPAEHEECDAGIPLQHPAPSDDPSEGVVQNQGNCTSVCCWFGGIHPAGQPSSPTLPAETFRNIDGAFDSLTGCHAPKLIANGQCHRKISGRAVKIAKLIEQGRDAYLSNNPNRAIRKLRRVKRLLDRLNSLLINRRVDEACREVRTQLSDQTARIAALNRDVQNSMAVF